MVTHAVDARSARAWTTYPLPVDGAVIQSWLVADASIPALIDGLRHPDSELRARAATVVAQIAPEDDEVVAALRSAAADRDEEVRRSAGQALDTMTVPFGILVTA